jgi:hypothetical protein
VAVNSKVAGLAPGLTFGHGLKPNQPTSSFSGTPKYIKEGRTVTKVTFHFSKGGKKSWREP